MGFLQEQILCIILQFWMNAPYLCRTKSTVQPINLSNYHFDQNISQKVSLQTKLLVKCFDQNDHLVSHKHCIKCSHWIEEYWQLKKKKIFYFNQSNYKWKPNQRYQLEKKDVLITGDTNQFYSSEVASSRTNFFAVILL